MSNILLWGIGIFFLLGGLAYIGKSIPAAIFMLLLSIVLIPASWNKIHSYKPNQLNRTTRIISAQRYDSPQELPYQYRG